MDFISSGIGPGRHHKLAVHWHHICVNARGAHVPESLEVLEYLTTHKKNGLNNGASSILPVFKT